MRVAYVDDPGHMGHTLKALIESRGDGLGVDDEGGKIEILSSRLVAQIRPSPTLATMRALSLTSNGLLRNTCTGTSLPLPV